MILGIDPGAERSGIVLMGGDGELGSRAETVPNPDILPEHARDVKISGITWDEVQWWVATVIGDNLVQHVRSPYPDGHPFTFFTNRMNDDSPVEST